MVSRCSFSCLSKVSAVTVLWPCTVDVMWTKPLILPFIKSFLRLFSFRFLPTWIRCTQDKCIFIKSMFKTIFFYPKTTFIFFNQSKKLRSKKHLEHLQPKVNIWSDEKRCDTLLRPKWKVYTEIKSMMIWLCDLHFIAEIFSRHSVKSGRCKILSKTSWTESDVWV